ncbi:MAG: exopolyphosphatase [Chitinophagales bacterium]
MELKKFAAIDIGSNSVRLLIEHVIETPKEAMFKKNSLIRVPVRLGADAFNDEKIPERTVKKLVEAMVAFRYLMQVNDVVYYKGCATSAMREARNGPEIVKRIRKEAGIEIEIISGNSEANVIFNSQNYVAQRTSDNCVFIDVGGGSTEITIFQNSKVSAAKSFDIGTIRLMNEQVTKEHWKTLRDWLKKETKGLKSFAVVGSGGNINRLSKLAELKQGKPLSLDILTAMHAQLKKLSVEERMKQFDLNPDRADVIVPAAEIFIRLMDWLDASKIYVPKIGLSDGLVREAYWEWKGHQRKGL